MVLITLDTVRADRLGCYGYAKETSPHIDALAKESAIFDLVIAQAAVTPVSHASILTGLEPYHHGLRVFHGTTANRLAEEHKTLAEFWQERGGETAAFVSAFPVSAAFGLDQGFSRFDAAFPAIESSGEISQNGVVNTGMSQRRADHTSQAAIAWLKARATPSKPFLLWAHYFDPHDALLLPPEPGFSKLLGGKFKPVSSDQADQLRAIYDAEIFFMDMQIGKLLNELIDLKLWDETIVAVVADHGEGLGDHNWWTHGILYQEQIRVPLIVRIPGLPSAAKRIGSLVRSIDIMPTILEATGIHRRYWPAVDGMSLLDEIAGNAASKPRSAYSDSVNMLNYARPDTQHQDRKNERLYALIEGELKFIYHQLRPAESELFDLRADPGESDNVAVQRLDTMQRFTRELESRGALFAEDVALDETPLENLKQLESLGYAG